MTARKRSNCNAPDGSLCLFDGWVLPILLDLEERADCRLISPLATATGARRSAVFAALAALVGGETPHAIFADMSPQRLTEWLLTTNPRTIIEQVYGGSQTLATIVLKTGGVPLDAPEYYAQIADIVSSTAPRQKRQARCLVQAQNITSSLLRTLAVLRDDYLHPALVNDITNSGMAQRIELVSGFLLNTCPDLTAGILAQSLKSRETQSLQGWASQMLLRHGAVDCDLCDDEDFVFLRSAADFHRAATDFHNCLADPDVGKLTNAALGVAAYAVYRHEPLIVELTRMHDGRDRLWVVEGVHAPDNGFVSDWVEDEIRAKLRDRGVLSLAICTGSDDLNEVAEHLHFADPFGRHALRRRHRRLRR